ncbi:hypothetical protein FHR32_003952 [Streptosporangium album]|uniref:Uncharacterized protein n=1 Tax=Streptosporangium album TaxID=47479 RepID=A0A7W7RX36_9ACTN|nr:hypothetical protein [Streptosporangium album]
MFAGSTHGRFVLTVKPSLHTVPYWHSPLESAKSYATRQV